MVKDHSDSKKENPLHPLHGRNGSFMCTIPETEHIPRHLLHQSWSTGCNEKQLWLQSSNTSEKDFLYFMSAGERSVMSDYYVICFVYVSNQQCFNSPSTMHHFQGTVDVEMVERSYVRCSSIYKYQCDCLHHLDACQ